MHFKKKEIEASLKLLNPNLLKGLHYANIMVKLG